MPRILLSIGVALVVVAVAHGDAKDGWVELFDGKTLTGWVIDGNTVYKDKTDGDKVKPLWTVTDGHIRTAGVGLGFLRYDKQFDDFVFHVEFKMAKEKDVNSGIGIRTCVYDPKKPLDSRPSFFSYEVQLLDDSADKPTIHGTGSLYRYIAPTKMAHKPAPEWNAIEIECIGPKIRVTMNETEVLSFDQSNDEKLKAKPLAGYVCLQSHSKPVEFRNVRIKPVKK